jgi:hypothetical protein
MNRQQLAALQKDCTDRDSRIAVRLAELVKEELTPIDREQRFRDVLDECYSFKDVGGPFAHMSPSAVLEEMDPIAFRCGVNDYLDDENVDEYEGDGESYEHDELQALRDQAEEEIDAEIADEEAEAEEAEAEKDEPGDVDHEARDQ